MNGYRLEHANIAVRDLEAMTGFLTTTFPDFAIRGEGGGGGDGRRWRHVGRDDCYIALEAADPEHPPRMPYTPQPGLNHLGWVVDDVMALVRRLEQAGLTPNLIQDQRSARLRYYFSDPDGNDWEFIEYRTEDVALRNDYTR